MSGVPGWGRVLLLGLGGLVALPVALPGARRLAVPGAGHDDVLERDAGPLAALLAFARAD